MTEYSRALLSELMAPYEQKKKRFDDEDVCKLHLVKFCPKEIFTNTKSDLGICSKIHDDALRKDYQSCNDKEKYGYEREFYETLLQIILDLDRKIKKGNERLNNKPVTAEEKQEKIIMLDEKIKFLLAKAEQAGEEGKVSEAQSIAKQVEQLETELEFVKNDESNPLFKMDKKMDVCNICGALLVTNDSARRLEAHMEGKQHTGYLRVRSALEEYQKTFGTQRKTSTSETQRHNRDISPSPRRHRSRSPPRKRRERSHRSPDRHNRDERTYTRSRRDRSRNSRHESRRDESRRDRRRH